MRIMFLGKRWYGSCARACCEALRRLGHNVADISEEDFGLNFSGVTGRIVGRALAPLCSREYNQEILSVARAFKPDFVLAFKGAVIRAETIRTLRRLGSSTYNYYPDRVALIEDREVINALGEYDCVFDTKRTWDAGVSPRLRLRNRVFLPHGYDPELHRPVVLDYRERELYGCDVGYIGNHMPRKESLLLGLVNLRPDLNFRIWGHRWQRADSRLQKFVAGTAITGTEYVKAISASRINLGIMGITQEAADETTTRTYEIPACGKFVLHERTPEVLDLYEEGREIECFSSPGEMASKIDFYMEHPEERERIALAGYRRCVPAYSYDTRVESIVRWHMERACYAGCERGLNA